VTDWPILWRRRVIGYLPTGFGFLDGTLEQNVLFGREKQAIGDLRSALDLSGVTDVQTVVLHTEDINGDGLPHGNVPFGFLAGDVDGNRVVANPDFQSVNTHQGGVTAANFRNDVSADGKIRNNPDGKLVKDRKGHSLP